MPAGLLRVFKQCKCDCWEQLTFWTVGESKDPKHPLTPPVTRSQDLCKLPVKYLLSSEACSSHVYSMTLWATAQDESRKRQFYSGAYKQDPNSWHSPSVWDNGIDSSWGQRHPPTDEKDLWITINHSDQYILLISDENDEKWWKPLWNPAIKQIKYVQ